MIRVNLYKIKQSMKSEYGLKRFIELKREFLDSCILKLYENVWSSTIQEVAVSEKETMDIQLMLGKIYDFFYNMLSAGTNGISISTGDVIEIERWNPAAENSVMSLNHSERYYCEANGFQPFQTIIVDYLRRKAEFLDPDLPGKPIREQIFYLYDCVKTITTADLFGLDSLDYLVNGNVDIQRVLPLLQGIKGIHAEQGDILQFNGIQRVMYNGIEWIPLLPGRVKIPKIYRGVSAIFTLHRVPPTWRNPKLYYYEARHGIGEWCVPEKIEHNVMENFYGTLITSAPLDLGSNGYIDLNQCESTEYTLQMLLAAGEVNYQ